MIRRIRRALRVPLAGVFAVVGLIGAAGLADGVFSPVGPRFSPRIAEAAPAADMSHFRPPQATTSTATPLIRLTPDTPTPVGGGAGGSATAEAGTAGSGGTSTGTPNPAATPGGTGGPGGAAPGSGPGRGEPRRDATSAALGTAGVMPTGTSPPGTDAGVDADPPSPRPIATSELGDFSVAPGSAGSAGTAGAIRDAPFQRSVGPFGVAVDVDDPAAVALWRQRGSPRADQSWAERLAANRPRPWGWWGFYPIAVLLFAAAAWRVVAGIRSGDGT